MGAGKSTLGPAVAERLGRVFVDVDRELERDLGKTIAELFEGGESEFRRHEERQTLAALQRPDPAVIALGGGAVETPTIRAALGERAFSILLDVDAETAWQRSSAGGRPLARSEPDFRALHERRRDLYDEVADARADDADDVVLAAGGVHVHAGSLELLGSLTPGDGDVALVSDPHVAGIHGADAQVALRDRLVSVHEVPQGEEAKTSAVAARLWSELRIDRGGTIVALGGGCTTDVSGFAAATYLRGVDWVPVPTTLVGQVDAAVGGKTGIDLPSGKNLVGAFHWPARVVVDPRLLDTLPDRELHEGRAEVVKTGLLAGEPLWELPLPELVRRSAAFKTALCLRDPYDQAERAFLNLGHTFAHALEAAAGYKGVTHGTAVGLGLLAALRLSGRATDVVEDVLAPRPVRVDRERAWAALQRDKKSRSGELRLVLLDERGPVVDTRPEAEVRGSLDLLIAD